MCVFAFVLQPKTLIISANQTAYLLLREAEKNLYNNSLSNGVRETNVWDFLQNFFLVHIITFFSQWNQFIYHLLPIKIHL